MITPRFEDQELIEIYSNDVSTSRHHQVREKKPMGTSGLEIKTPPKKKIKNYELISTIMNLSTLG